MNPAMPQTSNTRQTILDRIRAATTPRPQTALAYSQLPRTYAHHGQRDHEAILDLFRERLHEYGANVTDCAPAEIPRVLSERIATSPCRKLVAPSGLPTEWLVPDAEWLIDTDSLTSNQVEQCNGVTTAAFAAVAESGTIVLHHSATEGRRLISLLPDWHFCILRTSQIVETLPEYFARCEQPPTLATYIAGPSATADIEMTRIKGVHGPRFLDVLLVHNN